MTTTAGEDRADGAGEVRRGHPDHRRRRGHRAQGHPGHPGRRAARHRRSRGSATTRCSTRSAPAASAWSRCPTGKARRCPSRRPPARSTVADGHGRQHPAHLAGRRQGAAGRHGAAADQPPARLPGLRQGRRVPAAEPGDDQRPRRVPVRRAPSARSPSRSPSPRRCCSTASAACSARAAPGSPSRSPATRSSSCSSAARCSRSASTRTSRSSRYFSGNTIQICPVGALTSAAYRFRSRPFDLVSTPSVVRALRLRLRAAHRPPPRQGAAPAGRRRPRGQRGVELRQGPLRVPLRPRRTTGSPGRWSATTRRRAAAGVVARGARGRGPRPGRGARAAVGVLAGGRLTVEDAYAYAKFARVALGTNDIDFRARAALRRGGRLPRRARRRPRPRTSTYADLEHARAVAARRPRARGGVADRLPAAAQGRPRHGTLPVFSVAPYTSRGLDKLAGTLLPTAPGDEAGRARRRWPHDGERRARRRRRDPRRRAAGRRRPARCPRSSRSPRPPAPGSAGCRAAPASAARSRPAACPTCCPAAARSPTPPARVDLAAAWGVDAPARRRRPRHRRDPRRRRRRRARRPRRRRRRPRRPARPGAALAGARRGRLRRQPRAARAREVTERADVVLPGRAGRREGRHLRQLGGPGPPVRQGPARPARAARPAACSPARRRDGRRPRLPHRRAGRGARWPRLGPWDGDRAAFDADVARRRPRTPRPTARLVLATWQQLHRRRPAAGRRAAPAGDRAQPVVARRRRPRSPRSASTAGRAGHARPDRGLDRPARSRSPTCPTAWSGCRPARRRARSRTGVGPARRPGLDRPDRSQGGDA